MIGLAVVEIESIGRIDGLNGRYEGKRGVKDDYYSLWLGGNWRHIQKWSGLGRSRLGVRKIRCLH